MTSIPREINLAIRPNRPESAWASLFSRVHGAGFSGVMGIWEGLIYCTNADGRFGGTIPAEESDRLVFAGSINKAELKAELAAFRAGKK